jgi:hypothetical protein
LLSSPGKRICRCGGSSLGDQSQFPDHRPSYVRSLRRPSARYDCRLKCAGLAARSVQKIRRLSKNTENVLANANLDQVTIVGRIVLV